MDSFPESIRNSSVSSHHGSPTSMQHAERAYQGVTIAAMLVLLASLWVFW